MVVTGHFVEIEHIYNSYPRPFFTIEVNGEKYFFNHNMDFSFVLDFNFFLFFAQLFFIVYSIHKKKKKYISPWIF